MGHTSKSFENKTRPDPNQKVTSCFNAVLANEFTLFTKTLQYHWNITGPRFMSLHNFLEGHYNELLQIMDDVAERVRIIGDYPIGSIKKMYSEKDIKDSSEDRLTEEDMLKNLLSDHVSIQGQIKEILGMEDHFEHDPGSQDFLVSLLQKHEKMGWMLRSHLYS